MYCFRHWCSDDAHPSADREYGSSETRAFRMARIAEYDSVAVEPAPPPEVDKSLLSQRMLLLLTEKLDKAQRRLARPEVLRESQKLARDQARLRLAVGDVVFQRLSGESAAEHAHSAGDGDVRFAHLEDHRVRDRREERAAQRAHHGLRLVRVLRLRDAAGKLLG
jgi:hypothetical protein